MIELGHTSIVASYVVVSLALLLLGLFARWSWPVKICLIALVSASFMVVYFALPALLGWPSGQTVPKRFNLLAVFFQEPEPVTGEAGAIFFWATDVDPLADQRPRAYRLPFSLRLKTVFEEGRGKLRQNIPQIGEAELEDEVHGVPNDRQQLGQKSVKIKLQDAPPAGPPSKDAGG